ncbi:unnamed protein product [Amoebophrya sp. A25]|nr:unnamed protein product [Amoebophrya sp. A25]|eukprot:GSA25T00009167001.1
MCPHLLKWGYCGNVECNYAHHKGELQSTEAFVKTKMCNNPARCSYGQNCRYAHDIHELRYQVVLPRKSRQRNVPNFGQQLRTSTARMSDASCLKDDDDDLMCYPVADEKQGEYLTEARLKLLGFDKIYSKIFPASEKAEGDHDDAGLPDNQVLELDENETAEPVCAEDSEDRAVAIKGRKTLSPNILLPCLLIDDSDHDSKSTSVDVANKTTALADEEGKARDEHPPIVEVQLDVIRLQEDDIEEAIQEAIQEDDEKPRTAAPTTTPVYEDTKNHALVQQEDQQNKAAQILNALLMLEETEDADAESSMVLSEDVDDEKEEVDPRRSVVLEAPAEDEHAGEVQKTELEKEESSISSMELEVETSRINTNLLKEEEAKTTTMKKIEDPMLSASLVPAVEEVQLYSKEAAWNNTAIVEDEFMINSITVKKELHQVEQEPKHQDEKIPAAATIASDDVEVLPTDVVDGVESTLDHAPLPDLLFCTDSKLIKDTPMESLASTRLPTTVAQSTLTMAAQSTLTMAAQSTLTMVAQSTLTMRTEDDVVGEKKEEAEALKVHEEETKALAADTHAEAKGDEDEKEEDKCKVQETEDLVKTTQICDDAVAVDMEKKVDSSFCVTDHVVAAETASVVLPFSEESSDAALIAEKEADTSAAKKEVGEQADTTTKNASPLDQSTTDNMLPDSKDKGNEESEQKKPVTKGQRGYNKTNSTAGGPKSTSKIIPPPPPPPMGNKNLRRQLFENKKLRFENWQQKMGAAAALQRTAAEGDVGVSDSYPRSLGVLPGFDTALFGSTNSKFPPGRISNKNGKGPLAGAGTLSATLPPTTPTALVSGASPTGLGSWGQTPHNKAGFGTMGAFGAAGNGPLGGASTSGNSYQQNKRSKSSGKNSGSNAGGAAVSTSKNSTSSGTGASTTTLNSMGNNYSNKYKNDVNNSHSSLGGNGKASGGREGPFSGGLFSSSASGRYSGAKANGGKNTTSFNAGGASSNNNNYTSTGPGTSSSAAYNQGLSTGGRGSNSSNSYGGASSAYHNQQTGYGSRPSFPQVDSYQHGNHLGNMRKDTTSTSLLQPPPPVQPLPPLRSDNELSNSLLNVPPTAPSGDDPSGMSQQPMLMSSSASGTSANHKWMTPVGGLKGSTPALLGSSRHPATGYGGPSPSLGVPALLPLSSLSQPAPGASFSSIPPNGEPYSNSSAFPTASSAAQSSGLSSFSATVNNINMSSSTSTTILPPPLPAAQPQAVADLLFPTISMQSVESTANTLYPVANFGDKNTSSITTSACSGLGLSTSGFNNNNNVNFINIVSSSGSGGGILSSSTHLQQGTTSGTTLGNPMQPATSLFPTCNSSSASNNATSSLNHQLLASSGSSIGLMSPPPDALDSTSCSAIMNQNPSSCGIMATPSLFPTVSSSVVPQSACLNQLSSQQLLAPSINYNQNNSTSYNDYSSCGNFSGTTSAPGVLMARSMPQQSSFGSFLPLAGSEQQTIMGADNSTLLPPPPSPMSGGYPPLGVPNNANAAATSHGGRGFINSIMTSNAALQSPFFSGAGGPPIAPDLPPPITGPTTVLGGPSSSTFLFGGCTNASASVGMGLKPAGGMGTSLPTLGFNGHTVPVPPLPAFNFDSTCSGAFNFDSTCSGGYSTNSFSGGLAGGQGAAHCGSFFQDFASAGTGAPGASGTTGITFPAHASASSPDLVTCPDLTCSHQLGTNTTSVFGVTAPFPLPHPLEGSAKTPPLNMPTAQQTHQQGSEQQQSPGTYNNVAVVDGELPLLTCGDMCLQPFVQPTNSKANKPCPRHSTTGGLFVGARQSNTSLTGGAPGPRHSGTINPRRSTQLGGPARNSHSSHCSYGARGSVSSIARASVYTADHLLQSSPGRRSIRNGCPLTPPTPQGDRRNSV